jgi:hypothetical protein
MSLLFLHVALFRVNADLVRVASSMETGLVRYGQLLPCHLQSYLYSKDGTVNTRQLSGVRYGRSTIFSSFPRWSYEDLGRRRPSHDTARS